METTALRQEFHKLIDEFKDENVLEDFYVALHDYSQNKKLDIVDELTESQKQHLIQSIEQGKSGKTISHEQVLKKKTKGKISSMRGKLHIQNIRGIDQQLQLLRSEWERSI